MRNRRQPVDKPKAKRGGGPRTAAVKAADSRIADRVRPMMSKAAVPTDPASGGVVEGPLHPLHPWRDGATLQVHDGDAHFTGRREALEALELAGRAVAALIALGGYDRERLISACAMVGSASRIVAGMLPSGAMPQTAAMLSDLRKPHYANWLEAEQRALELVAPDASKYALAEADADGKRRGHDAFRHKRTRG